MIVIPCYTTGTVKAVPVETVKLFSVADLYGEDDYYDERDERQALPKGRSARSIAFEAKYGPRYKEVTASIGKISAAKAAGRTKKTYDLVKYAAEKARHAALVAEILAERGV